MRALLIALALSGCCTPDVVRVPVEVVRHVPVIEPVPDELLQLHPADEAAGRELDRCPDIARERLAEIRICNDHKRAIRARQD